MQKCFCLMIKSIFCLSIVHQTIIRAIAYYGFTLGSLDDIRKLTYEYASVNCVQVLQNRLTNKIVGGHWFTSFLNRYSSLSIRIPGVRSLRRAASFNPSNGAQLFQNLSQVLEKHKFKCQDIYNYDKNGVNSV